MCEPRRVVCNHVTKTFNGELGRYELWGETFGLWILVVIVVFAILGDGEYLCTYTANDRDVFFVGIFPVYTIDRGVESVVAVEYTYYFVTGSQRLPVGREGQVELGNLPVMRWMSSRGQQMLVVASHETVNKLLVFYGVLCF